ncbi:lysophospholipid acyltransferase family protein [Pedomonas mirosovicensis]|uniref:lysophospholipid acyltransferase family protein n=1 Tax=Pedomonas mirosovicensis TaxID=2908641 RepID=UPI0021685A6E|nr:lysophospholipid acyltransferase family protein [Pedomonas mirosovicensis]MCH8683996.1 1-acyl-sn-glycerol-3-phosphate acyltransferase [Pedomonas mirosovicensis]
MGTAPLLNPFSDSFDRDWRAVRALTWASLGLALYGPAQAASLRLRPEAAPRIPRAFHRLFCRAIGMKVDVIGAPVSAKPTLYVSNHISWVDIPVLGSRILGSFVAKSEVGQWGMVGRLSDLQRTIYVERERRTRSREQSNVIAERMAAGHSIILFPEGTSTSGRTVKPFKTSLFAIAEADGMDATVQPVTLAYTHINGLPMLRSMRHKVAWIGDMDLLPHAWELFGLGRVRALIQFHEPVRPSDFANRKELARHCEQVIAEGLLRANRGEV